MPYFLNETSNQFIAYKNNEDSRLRVNEVIEKSLAQMNFIKRNYQDCERATLKLIIHHGAYQDELTAFNYPTTRLKMSSQGFIKPPEKVSRAATEDPVYFLQGGESLYGKPTDENEWKRLIAWLLSVHAVHAVANGIPLPTEEEIRKYVFTEPYPEALFSYYLAEKTREKGVDIELDDQVIAIAREDFGKLARKFFGEEQKAFDRMNDLESVFQRISEELSKK